MGFLKSLFRGSKSSQDVYTAYVDRMFALASGEIGSLPWEENETRLSDVVFEFVYFYLHMTDRAVFGHMTEDQRAAK